MGNKSSLMLQDDEIKQISGQTGFSPQQIEKLYSRFTQLDRANCGSLSKNDLLSIPELAINPLCDRLIEMFFSEAALEKAGHARALTLAQVDEDRRINFRQFMHVLAAFRSNQHQQRDRQTPGEHSADSDETRSSESDENLSRDEAGFGAQFAPRSLRNSNSTNARPPMRNHRGRRPQASGELGSASRAPANSLTQKLHFVFKIYDNDNDGRISFNDLRSILKLMVGSYIEEVQLDKIATRTFVEVDQDNDGFVEFGEFCRVFAGKDMEDKLRVKFR